MDGIKYVKYLRVSTAGQMSSGLGISAQSDIIDYFIRDGEALRTFTEAYTGTDLKGCVELRKAIKFCKENGAKLILYKSDRFRNVSEAISVLDELGEGNLICVDIPGADRFTFILFFAIAEREALLISMRTKSALAQIKKTIAKNGSYVSRNGNTITHLGRKKGSPQLSDGSGLRAAWKNRIGGDKDRQRQWLLMKDLAGRGDTLDSICATLNATGETAPNGGQWTKGQVSRALSSWSKYFVRDETTIQPIPSQGRAGAQLQHRYALLLRRRR